MPQSFLKTCQHRLLVSRFDIDHPVRREPSRSECRREQILAGHAPQHATPGPRCDPCGEECSGSPVYRAVTAAGHFVQRPERQSAFRQTLINGLDAERQYRAPMPRPALKASNALAKRLDNGNRDRRIHALLQLALRSACSLFVLIVLRSQSAPRRIKRRMAAVSLERISFMESPLLRVIAIAFSVTRAKSTGLPS